MADNPITSKNTPQSPKNRCNNFINYPKNQKPNNYITSIFRQRSIVIIVIMVSHISRVVISLISIYNTKRSLALSAYCALQGFVSFHSSKLRKKCQVFQSRLLYYFHYVNNLSILSNKQQAFNLSLFTAFVNQVFTQPIFPNFTTGSINNNI